MVRKLSIQFELLLPYLPITQMKKLTQDEFVTIVKTNYGDRIDISQFQYAGRSGRGIAICKVHGPYTVSANSLIKGAACPECRRENRTGKFKDTLASFVSKASGVHNNKYDYSRSVYSGAKRKLTIICPDHGEFEQEAWSHLHGQGCSKCADISVGLRSRLTHAEFLRKAVETHGDRYDLSLVRYTGLQKRVDVVCEKHGVFHPQAGNFIRGSGCPSCGRESVGKKSRRKEASYIAEAVKVHGGRFSYGKVTSRNGITMMRVICPVHGMFEQNAQDHLSGVGCVKCSKPVRDMPSFLLEARKVHGDKYDYSSVEYRRALEKVTITCPIHGPFEQTPSSHISAAQGCPVCANCGPSKGHVEIAEFLQQYTEVLNEYAFDSSRRRLDVYLPEHNLAVEYHGLIWHSTAFSQDPLRDYKKHSDAANSGIRVIHIYEDEWKLKRQIVEKILLSSIGKSPKVFARKASVVQVSAEEARTFMENNHIQGASKHAKMHFGLKIKSEIVACMSFSIARSSRSNTDQGLWELQRYASSVTVVGGASRLLKTFLDLGLCHTLVSYSDSRLFSGRMYAAMGFQTVKTLPPDYCYVRNNSRVGRFHKSGFQRKHLHTRLDSFDPQKTEVQNCLDNGWYQLYDCGKKKWVLTLG